MTIPILVSVITNILQGKLGSENTKSQNQDTLEYVEDMFGDGSGHHHRSASPHKRVNMEDSVKDIVK